jgi:hypothetical protein
LSAYLDTSVLLPTLIAEPTTEAVYDCLGAGEQELLISFAWPCSAPPTHLRVWRILMLGAPR